MQNSNTFADPHASHASEWEAIKAESMGWLPLGEGVYLHHGQAQPSHEAIEIQVVGLADTSMAGLNVLLLV